MFKDSQSFVFVYCLLFWLPESRHSPCDSCLMADRARQPYVRVHICLVMSPLQCFQILLTVFMRKMGKLLHMLSVNSFFYFYYKFYKRKVSRKLLIAASALLTFIANVMPFLFNFIEVNEPCDFVRFWIFSWSSLLLFYSLSMGVFTWFVLENLLVLYLDVYNIKAAWIPKNCRKKLCFPQTFGRSIAKSVYQDSRPKIQNWKLKISIVFAPSSA